MLIHDKILEVFKALFTAFFAIGALISVGVQGVILFPGGTLPDILYPVRSWAICGTLALFLGMLMVEIAGYSAWEDNWVKKIVHKVKNKALNRKAARVARLEAAEGAADIIRSHDKRLAAAQGKVRELEALLIDSGIGLPGVPTSQANNLLEIWTNCENLTRVTRARFRAVFDYLSHLEPYDVARDHPGSKDRYERDIAALKEVLVSTEDYLEQLGDLYESIVNQRGNVGVLHMNRG